MQYTPIRTAVSPETITKVTRLFNGTLEDITNELLQNSRRAGSTIIRVTARQVGYQLAICFNDNGSGISQPSKVLTLGTSGWAPELAQAEDPAGMGVFSLSGREITISSRTRNKGLGWKMTIGADAWTGEKDIHVTSDNMMPGTSIDFVDTDATLDRFQRIVAAAAKHCPTPVYFNKEELPRADFLDGAIHIVEWNGSRIGVFTGSRYHQTPTVNFHGLTITARLAEIAESFGRAEYHARLDIGSTPGLQLVLPARKEFVQNDLFADLVTACRKAIYEAISNKPSHRLSFASWKRARDLGIDLPEAEPVLYAWMPATADNDNGHPTGEVLSVDPQKTSIVDNFEPHIAAPIARAIHQHQIRENMAEQHTPYEGYSWYDRLPKFCNPRFYIDASGSSYANGENGCCPVLDSHIEATGIELRYNLTHAASETEREFRVPADVSFISPDDRWGDDLDNISIAYVCSDSLTPEDLADLIEEAFFCASDDCEADSWDTQHDRFVRDARELATRLLHGENAAIRTQFADHLDRIRWMFPKGKIVTIRIADEKMEVSVSDCQETA